jgi:hypothetical protein
MRHFQEIMQRLREHHNTRTKCKPMRRGGQFDFYCAGNMITGGAIAPRGGGKGAGYAPVAGFDAKTGDGIDLIFNEVEVIHC